MSPIRVITILTLLLLLTTAFIPARAQAPLTVSVNSLDTSQFPNVTAEVTVLENGISKNGLTAANFAVFEDDNPDNLLNSAEEVSNFNGLAFSIVFDFDPSGDTSLYRPMQEYAQTILSDLDMGSPADPISHQVEVRTSSGKTVAPYTSDLVTVKNGIRQMLIEDMQNRRLNETLTEILGQDTGGRKQVVLIIGSGGDALTTGPVIDRAIQRGAVIHTLAFSDKADRTYLDNLAVNTRGHFYGNPQDISPNQVKIDIFSDFQSMYRLNYRSQLYQTDQNNHTATVAVNIDNIQAQNAATFTFPPTTIRPKFNSMPLLWAYSGILGISVLLLIFRLYRQTGQG